MNVNDFLIEQENVNWVEILQHWGWLLPSEFTLWLVNRFADLFMVTRDGSVHMLRTDNGQLQRLADTKEQFLELIDKDDNAADWLAMPLVDRCVSAGMTLKAGECYGFKLPPVIGAPYELNNIAVKHIDEYLHFLADFYYKIKDLPDGTKVKINIGNA